MLFMCATAFAADPPASRLPLNEQIMFGNVAKTPEQLALDKDFVDSFAARGLSRRQGSNEAAAIGWQYMRRRDIPTAIKRFNQAWLLDPENYEPYWGFATVIMDRDKDPEGSERMFRKAIDMYAHDIDLLVDYARFLLRVHRPDEAIVRANDALAIDAATRDANAVIATAYLMKKDVGRAQEYAKIARERGETYGSVPTLGCMLDNGITSTDSLRALLCLFH